VDLNYLLHRHQVSLVRAESAACFASGYAHRGLAKAYAERIDTLRNALGAPGQIVVRT
jgi:hypothetical protein